MAESLVLIDGDIIVYRCAFAAERTRYLVEDRHGYLEQENHKLASESAAQFGGTIWSRKEVEPVENALQAAKTSIENLLARSGGSGYRIYLSDALSHREAIARTRPYKGNRSQAKPHHYDAVKEYLLREYNAIIRPRQEADDAIGIAATAAFPDVLICSIDKDLRQIAGWHFPLFGGVGERDWVSKRAGDFQFYSQLLSGDTVDNVPGLPSVGAGKAAKILEGSVSCKELCERVWAHYKLLNCPYSYFREQADLLYILRDDSGPDREGYYWRPPSGAIKL